ncbi:MAG: DMT family transporter [Chloroflexota bacterium]
MSKNALPYTVFLGMLWGLNLVLGRFGLTQFDVWTYTGYRLIIAVVIFASLITILPNWRWPRDWRVWRDAIFVGVFGTALPLLTSIGSLNFQSAGVTSLLATTGPAFVVTSAHFLLPDAKLTRTATIGVAVALGGAVLIIALGETGLPDLTEANPIGYFMVIGTLFVDSLIAVYVRRRMQNYDAVEVTSVRMLAAMCAVIPFMFLLGDFMTPVATLGDSDAPITFGGWGALLFSAIGSTVIAQFLFFYVTRTFGTTKLAIAMYIVPVTALVSGVVFLGETVTVGMGLGMVSIITGIYLINRK